MSIAAALDYFGYGFTMMLFMGIPAAGLVVNIAGMQRQGLNQKAGLAACLFFATLLVQGSTVTLAARGAFPEDVEFWLLVGTGVANVLGAMLALWGIYQMRRRHRWNRGKKRAVAVFWLNILILILLGAAFFLWTHPEVSERIFG